MGKRLTQREWGEIQTVWESGASTPKQISIDYGVNLQSLRNKASLNKWKKCGSVIQTVVKEARKEFADETRESFKKTAQKANKRHIETLREIHELGKGYSSLLRQELGCALKGDKSRLKKIQKVIEQITLGKRANWAGALANMVKEGINGERKVIGLDEMKHEDQENTLDQLVEAIDRARRESGIRDVPVG